ncbi:hypothetical protein DAEQUDRAFT_513158 [Daedalea quercina L-15889]|uniref:Uncharacterized protein n=1 Tax=Daedalea quercina L-15889 TaxID=1314783 RepID=A0A165MH91_9APHY|nr:hypothetical protein DAEQUDRAFT_513158 [Daedalea quercina L-15889]
MQWSSSSVYPRKRLVAMREGMCAAFYGDRDARSRRCARRGTETDASHALIATHIHTYVDMQRLLALLRYPAPLIRAGTGVPKFEVQLRLPGLLLLCAAVDWHGDSRTRRASRLLPQSVTLGPYGTHTAHSVLQPYRNRRAVHNPKAACASFAFPACVARRKYLGVCSMCVWKRSCRQTDLPWVGGPKPRQPLKYDCPGWSWRGRVRRRIVCAPGAHRVFPP